MTFKILGDPTQNNIGNPIGRSGKGGFQWNQFLDFEGGNIVTPPVSAWDSVGGAGAATILTTAAAAIRGNFGSQIGMPNTNIRIGNITGPTNEKKFLLDFLFDPNGIVLAAANRFILVTPLGSGLGGGPWSMFLGNIGSPIELTLGYITDAGARVDLTAVPIADQAVHIAVEWEAASVAGANDGSIRFFVNGILEQQAEGINNDQHDVDSVTMGAVGSLDVGTTGTIFFDNVRWANKFR